MTIKNQGGVFGRNPTFNDVSVDGSLSIGGSLVPSPSDITTLSTNQTLTGDKTFNGDVGIGAAPNATHKLNVLGTPKFTSGAGTGYALVQLGESSTATNNWHFGSEGNGTFRFYNGNLNAGALKLMLDSSGNLVMNSGSGIDFSATAGTGTSELLDDYEEGEWTPIDASGAGLSFVSPTGVYTKIGRTVMATGFVQYPVTGSGANTNIGGLPFTNINSTSRGLGVINYRTVAAADTILPTNNATTFIIATSTGGVVTNAQLSNTVVYFGLFYTTS
jgi:hypothetical protein